MKLRLKYVQAVMKKMKVGETVDVIDDFVELAEEVGSEVEIISKETIPTAGGGKNQCQTVSRRREAIQHLQPGSGGATGGPLPYRLSDIVAAAILGRRRARLPVWWRQHHGKQNHGET